MHGQQNIKK